MLKFGLDLDGVTVPFITPFDAWMQKNRHVPKIRKDSWDVEKRYGISEKIVWEELNNFADSSHFLSVFPYSKAKDKIWELSNIGEIYVITNRGWNEQAKLDTLSALMIDMPQVSRKNIFFEKNKGDLARELELDYFFEDVLGNAKDIIAKSPETKIILMDKPYNQGFSHPAVRRVNSWYDINIGDFK